MEQLGGLSILVNNAGRQQYCETLEELTTEDFDATFKTNVYAPFWITRAALPHLQAGSAIINTTSVQAYKPSPILLDYAQTKACLAIFTKSLAKQVAKRGIRVNAVAPGPYWTVLQSSGGQPDEKVKQFGKDTPMGRPGQPVRSPRCMSPWHPMPAHIPPDRCGVLTAGMVWSKPPGIPTRASARRYFPANPCGYILAPASRLRQFFLSSTPLLLPHAMMSARRCALTLARRHP